MTKTIPELALPLQIPTPQQREDYPMRIGLLWSKSLVIQCRYFSIWRIRYKIKILGSEPLLRKRKPPVGQGAGSCSKGGRTSRRGSCRPVVGFGEFVNGPPNWMNSKLDRL
ncbi:hypothetical protein AVEN_105360-1 [Araneus ventricosus]|uniref:Uncharacterized protein n=1 Tax=Araneus ventricosus TaxID=182803 RepID=A0A4Y2Q1N4_ARAVE|nr:hypothetical protein AVEN_105360-1 [Araneus ventricosus]